MQVTPEDLRTLAQVSESISEALTTAWNESVGSFVIEDEQLGDASGAAVVGGAYGRASNTVASSVATLVTALANGGAALRSAAGDVSDADDGASASMTVKLKDPDLRKRGGGKGKGKH